MRFARLVGLLRTRSANLGWCDICERRAVFVALGTWLRDDLVCLRCQSIPRWRATMRVLADHLPSWREADLYEPSPGGALSRKLARECRGYVASHYQGQEGIHQDLEQLTWPDASFDVVVTQDVMEHIPDPARAFAEIARVLRPGGRHVFTTPVHDVPDSVWRARRSGDGSVEHVLPPVFHEDPDSPEGSLVFVDWGRDLPSLVRSWSGLATERVVFEDRRTGLDGAFLDVFVSQRGP